MPHKRGRLTGLLVLCAVVMAGCGSGGSSSTLSRSQLISQADVICKRVNEKLADVNSKLTSQQAFASIAPELAAFERQELSKLEALKPPASMSSDWRQILASTRTLTDTTAQLGVAAKKNDLKSAQQLANQNKKAQESLVSITTRDGFKECSKEA